jgi:hypothetical protein
MRLAVPASKLVEQERSVASTPAVVFAPGSAAVPVA